jgi:hypothetical protein
MSRLVDSKVQNLLIPDHAFLLALSHCLLEDELVPTPPCSQNLAPQSKWVREDNLNWIHLRDIPDPAFITVPEAKEMVRRYMKLRRKPKVINKAREPIASEKIHNLVAQMYNMF